MRWASLVVLLFVAGCSLGGSGTFSGPHPQVSWATAAHVGPVEVTHAAISNSRPVTDLTGVAIRLGPTFGQVQPTVGLGWQVGREWTGPCNSAGHQCKKVWRNGPLASIGVTYRSHPFRADASLFLYERAAVDRALVVLFGFDL